MCWDSINTSFALSSKTVVTNCSFIYNHLKVIEFLGKQPLVHAEIYFNGPIYIFRNSDHRNASEIMLIKNFNVHIKGPVYISENSANYVMSIYSVDSNILFDGIIVVSNNKAEIIMVFYSSYVMFNGPLTVSQNLGTAMLINICDLILNGPIVISMNDLCESALLLQYSDILLTGSIYHLSQIIVIKLSL